jgi:hypothetical protein
MGWVSEEEKKREEEEEEERCRGASLSSAI